MGVRAHDGLHSARACYILICRSYCSCRARPRAAAHESDAVKGFQIRNLAVKRNLHESKLLWEVGFQSIVNMVISLERVCVGQRCQQGMVWRGCHGGQAIISWQSRRSKI